MVIISDKLFESNIVNTSVHVVCEAFNSQQVLSFEDVFTWENSLTGSVI